MVSGLSIFFMAVSALVSVGLPVALFLVLRKRCDLKAVPMLVGAAAFVVFALVLESLLHQIVLRPGGDGSIPLIRSNPWLYVIYAVFAAGIFEETARLVSFVLLKKKYAGIGTGIAYGIGHGGIEAISIVGLAMISNIILSVAINFGFGGLMSGIDDSAASITISTLTQTAPSMFLVAGFERIVAIAIHISLSLFVWHAVQNKERAWLFPAAILMHAAVNVPAAMYQAGMISSIALVQGLVFVFAAIMGAAAYKVVYRAEAEDETEDEEEDETEQD